MTARGIRNNNPGNIVRDATKWQGMAPQQTDPRFVVFTSPAYGIRALAKVLLSYQHDHKLDTIAKIIARWAPAKENNTDAYVADVATACGVSSEATIDVDSVAVMLPLVTAIIRHENGEQPYTAAELLDGLHLAGISDAPAPAPEEPPPGAAPAPPVETQNPVKSKTVWGGILAAAIPVVLSIGPFLMHKLGMDDASSQQTTNALAELLGAVSGQLVVVGRANANIKPLG